MILFANFSNKVKVFLSTCFFCCQKNTGADQQGLLAKIITDKVLGPLEGCTSRPTRTPPPQPPVTKNLHTVLQSDARHQSCTNSINSFLATSIKRKREQKL